VFENRVLRGIFGTKRDEVTGGWRKFHHEELYNWYLSPNIILSTISRMRWAEHAAHERDHHEDLVVDGRINRILKLG
jgi:hypothetical protein